MTRSFTDRVMGGVCGGLAEALRLNPWIVRVVFVVGAVLTGGLLAAVYVALWWTLPQASLVNRRGGAGSTLLAVLVIVGLGALWAAHTAGLLLTPDGQSLYGPALALVLAVVYLLRQLRAS